MKLSKIKQAFVLVLVSSSFVLGCELIVDFDRTRIPVEGAAETGPLPDATVIDTGAPDTDVPDAEPDAADDAAADAGDDAADDAATDAATD